MKTFSIALILILAFAVTANAEVTTYGIKGGLAMAKMTGDDTDDLKTKTGFMIGGFAAIPLSPSLSIQPEAYYVQKGAKFDDAGTDVKIKFDYLDIPVLLKYTVAGESATPYFLFGPSLGFNMSAKVDDVDIKDNVSSTDFGLVFGLGVNIQKFLLEVRYNLGLTDIDEYPDSNVKNSVIGILAGYTF